MEYLNRISVDWSKTGKKLEMLRLHNEELRRYVCFYIKTKNHDCEGTNCEKCFLEMDKSISRRELSEVFLTSENVITNWENGKSIPQIEDILLYCEITKLDLLDILVY